MIKRIIAYVSYMCLQLLQTGLPLIMLADGDEIICRGNLACARARKCTEIQW